MNRKAKGSRSERRTRKSVKELGYSLLGAIVAIAIIVFVVCMKVRTWFVSPFVPYVGRVRRKMSRE